MKKTLNKLKKRRYTTSILLVVLIVFVIGLFSILKPNIKNIKVKDVFIKSSSLNASVIDGVSEDVTSNNYDEIKYKLKVNKENSDTAVIVGRLTDKESRYARFKSTKEGVVTDNGKTITVTTTKNKLNITVIVENAPYGSTVDPKFTINSEDESKSEINVEPVTITGKSVEGTVTDENGTSYEGIELKLTKNEEEVKRTYSKENGKYVFSLGDTEGYQISLAETKYQIVRFNEETTDENRRVLNVVIKEVEPFNLSVRKTISKLDLVVNGNKQTYTYDDASVVSKSVKGAKTIEGSIYYNIYIKNSGEVKGTLAVLKDALPDGLSFDESKNPGWSKEGKYLFYTPLEGKEIEPFEKEKVTLVLDIVKTNEAKTYINTINANGEDYKYVVYYLNNNVYKEEYVINSEKVEDINPNVENFDGWYTDRNYTNKYDFKLPVTKDTILFGKIANNKYNVSFIDINPNNNQETVLDIVEVNEGDSVDLIDHPEYRGYTFKCFKLYNRCYDNEEITDDVSLYTSYTIDEYEIDYDLDGGSVSESNPDRYTVNDEITLHNPTKQGHTFTGWYGTDLSELTLNVTIPRGSIGNREYIANYEINRSSLTVNPNGGLYEGAVSNTVYIEDYGTIKHINDSERTGYNFTGYTHTGGGTFNNGTYTFDDDDAELTANYEIITYDIRYENITDAEREALRNPIHYDVETETFTLREPETRVDGDGNPSEDFIGWDDGSGTASKNITIPKGSTGNRTYTAVWRQNGKEYKITYELNGGTLSNPNPNKYTRASESITLNNPTKNGYRFVGWSGTDLIGDTNQIVIIPTGSAGDRHYVAHYEVIEYTIEYNGLLPTEDLGNPLKYTIESDDITLHNPSRTGYNFLGWTGSNGTTPGNVTIPHGSTGDKSYTVNFSLIEYSLTYTLNGGTVTVDNPDKYTIESDDITLHNPTREGYRFIGWTGTDVTNPTMEVTIPTGSIGHRSFLANYEPIGYTITYDYGEGALPDGVTNPDRYTIESAEITFNSPVREGYDFTNYTENGNIITSIPTGSMGDKSLVAHYQIRKYNVRYFNENNLYHTDEVDWNTQTTAPATDPTKPHNIFLYWSEDGTTSYVFTTPIVADKDLYAVYEEVETPEITITPSLDDTTNRTWVCSDSSNTDCGVTVTITSDHNDYELYYKIGDNAAVLYTEPFKVYENVEITAFSKKSNIYSEEVSEDVINVDSIAPTINQPATGSMSFNMTVSGTAQDAGSGVKKFTLYVKEKDALTWDDTLTYESETFDGIRDHAENYDHTFYGVQENTEYVIKIVSEDYVGNISEREVEVTTHPYVARVVGKNGMLWYTVDPDTKEFVIEDGKEFLLFDSIQAAVDYCAEVQCTIQTNPILPVVNETVTVAANQYITIDLDGRGITSDQSATFINNGKLQIVDRNPRMNGTEHESIGFVKNTTDKAIVNNDKFILGDGSSEPSETFIYPELDRPIIEGVNNALEQNNLFYFYDGKLVSEGTVILDRGEDAITQYSYNAVLTGEDDKNIATLEKVTDPEARIRSTYYAKLKNTSGLNAFDSSRTGTITTEEAKLLSKIKQAGDYGFIYDSINDEIYNGNSSTAGTTAISYLKLDLTNEPNDVFISFDAFADTYNSNSYGYVSVSEELGQTGTQIFKAYGNDNTASRLHCLEKGKVHYIYFGLVKGTSDVNKYETFRISNFRIVGEKQDTNVFNMYRDKEPSYYSFEKQADGTYLSANKGVYNTTAHSYTMFDLRGETEDVNLLLTVSNTIGNGGDRAWVYTSNNIDYQGYDDTNGRYYAMNSGALNKTVIIPLKAGEVTYLHFGFYNYYDAGAGFSIDSIAFAKSNGESIIPTSQIEHNSGDSYYFVDVEYDLWEDLTGSNKDVIVFGATLNEAGDGYVFDGNDYAMAVGGITDTALTNESVELEFSTTNTNNQVYYIGNNNQNIGIGVYNGYIIVSNKNSAATYMIPENFADGERHKLTVTYDGTDYLAYFDSTPMEQNTTTNTWGSSGNLNIGRRDVYDDYFVGTIYGLKVFDRALSSDEIADPNSDGLILHLDAARSTKTRKQGYINNNIGGYYTTAHGYVIYDLTNVNEDKYLYVNTAMSRSYGYAYVAVSDSTSVSGGNGRAIEVSSTGDNFYGVVKLSKNKVNYVHFVFAEEWNSNPRFKDFFLIKDLKYCDTIEDAYSFSPSSYSNIDKYYFEKPVLNEKVDTIEILKDITLNTAITVPQEKEVILDLNGFTLTTEKDDYIIKNNGKLTITDSDYEDRRNRNIDYKTEQARLYEDAKAAYLADLEEYEEYTGTCDGCEPSLEYKLDHILEYASDFGVDLSNIDSSNIHDYSYTGDEQEFNVTENGLYILQVWGAQGGYRSNTAYGGAGGYSEGVVQLNTGEKAYVYVGGSGNTGSTDGGFNGGGSRFNYPGGGGATDIRVEGDTLNNRIIVAGGGGSDGASYQPGGAGGGETGGSTDGVGSGGGGATQTSAGTRGDFGNGGSGSYTDACCLGRGYAGAGGGGWYGGGGSNPQSGDRNRGGGGGSGFIFTGTNDVPNGYDVTNHVLFDAKTLSGTSNEIPTYDGLDTMTGNTGDGYAKITLLLGSEYEEIKSNLPKTYNVKIKPRLKDYVTYIDFDNSVDVDNITTDTEVSYNDIVGENISGSITTTISNAILNEQYATLTMHRGSVNVNVNSKQGIVNRGKLIIDDHFEINANNSSSIGVFNESNGEIIALGGVIKAKGSSSIGLLNRSNTPVISGIVVNTTPTDATGIYNNAVDDVSYNNVNISGAGLGFREDAVANTTINNSSIKSTGNSSLNIISTTLADKLVVNGSSFSGTFSSSYSPEVVVINNSTLSDIYNYYGSMTLNSSTIGSIDNRGEMFVNGTTINGSGRVIYNYYKSSPEANNALMVINNSIINSTATSATNVVENTGYLTVINTKFNNTNSVSSTAIRNLYPGYDSRDEFGSVNAYLNISGTTSIDSSFGTAIENTGIVTIGTNEKNIGQEYAFGYTGAQEEFVAPEAGTYKLETWGAQGGGAFSWDGRHRGGFGAYASGEITLNAGDKLYIHVGGFPSQKSYKGNYGTYNGGGITTDYMGYAGGGGGATDISLSSEDNTWQYINGVSRSVRSNESYAERILVAAGGGRNANAYGIVDLSSNPIGYGNDNSGGGYYGGSGGSGGSSYASDTLTNVVIKSGSEEMPDYSTSGLMQGNLGYGYAKITLLNTNSETISNIPTISATNYGITGSGKVIYLDGTINANVAINSDIETVPENYDIYNSIDENNKEKIILIANADSRPVESGEEFVAAIGNAKYTTIQNALDASNNGDEIDLLVDIEQQNMIVIPANKTITIDYNGHKVKSYNNQYLYKNLGNLTITDSQNELKKNTFMGDKYIYNEGTLNMSNIYIADYNYTTCLIDNNEGTVTLDSVKLDFGTLVSSKSGIYNTENGTINVKNSTLNLYNANNMFDNYGTLTLKDNTILGSSSASIVINRETGVATLDGNSYSVSGNDNNGRYFLYNESGNATVKNMNTHVEDLVNTGTLTLEDNNIPSGALSSSGLIIINSGTYNNTFSISGEGKTIDNTDNLYSFIMHDGTINTTLNRSASGIFNIEKGTISVTSGSAISNTSVGTINIGIHDGNVDPKASTEPVITGITYGIYTTNPALVVNFYDGIVSAQTSYNVTIENIETGYSIYRDYDDVNNIETKYLTNEPMFTNSTQGIDYDSVNDLNDAITNGLVNNNDTIKAYRNITISKNDASIIIPVGLNITFDLNGKIIDKNNDLMFTVNGSLTTLDSVSNSNGKIDSTNGNIFENNGTLNITSGTFISERDYREVAVVLNNENATLNISDGNFTKYYDNLKDTSQLYRGFGSVIINSGDVNITGGNYVVNSSFRGGYGWGVANYMYSSNVFYNNETGVINASNMTVDGFPSLDIEPTTKDYTSSISLDSRGEFFTNKGILNISDSTSENSLIGENTGTVVMENVTMNRVRYLNKQYYNDKRRPIVNSGTFTIKGGTYITEEPFTNSGTFIIDEDSSHNGTTIRRTASGITYSLVGSDQWTTYVIQNTGNMEINKATILADSISTSTAVTNESTGYIKVSNSTLKSNDYPAISNISSGSIEVYGDSLIESKATYGIENSSSGTVTVGQTISIDSEVSQVNPIIKGNTYGIRNSGSGTFNFYDGILEGKTSPVTGVINNIEPGYMIIDGTDGDYKTNYLDRVEIIQNITQATASDEKKYYDLKTAFDEVNDGDTLQMIANYSNLPDDLTAVNNNNVILDLNDKFIRQSNDLLITNNGTLNIIDSSQNKAGNIIAVSGSKVIDNYGTILFESGNITTSTLSLLIKNNTSATITIRNEANLNASCISTLINNDGTVNIYNGAYLHNNAGSQSLWNHTNSGLPMIYNTNILNIIDYNNDDDEYTSSTYPAPKLHSSGVAPGNNAYWFEDGYADSTISNTSTGTVTIYGGVFNNGNNSNPDAGKILYNKGDATIKNLDSYAYMIGHNTGTLTIENSNFHNFGYAGLTSQYGTLNIKDTTINFYADYFITYLHSNNIMMYVGNATFDNVTFTGGQHTNNSEQPLYLINIVEPTIIKDSSIDAISETCVLTNASNLTIQNTPINMDKYLANSGTLILENSDVTVTNSTGISNSGTLTLDNSNVSVTDGTAISNSGTVNLNPGITVSTTSGNGISTSGTLNVPIGASVISQNGYGISISGGTANIGEIGGVPDQTSPYIEGSTYGIYKSDLHANLNFYDGLIVGSSGPNAIYGGVSDVEGGYETEDVIDTTDNKHHEYLVVSATSVAIATVGTYTFSANNFISPSRALQNAINFAIGDGTNVRNVNLVTNVDLTNDEFSLTASMPITIITNGNTITTDSTYTIDGNITLNNNNGLGGSVSRFLSDVFDLTSESKNIIIYELSDGSKLDVTKTYRLYRDGKLLSLEKEEYGRYKYNGDNDTLIPIKGRLYIDNLQKGSYKLESSDNKYIEFNIDSDGNISGNVVENTNKASSISDKSEAELILSIQTGIERHYYILFIIPIALVIILLMLIKHKKREII